MRNDIVVANAYSTDQQIELNQERIISRDGSKVFPINNALKKELRRLKEERIGDLKTQIDFLKKEKWEAYIGLHEKKKKSLSLLIEKENKRISKIVVRVMKEKRVSDQKIKAMREVRDKRSLALAKVFYPEIDALHKQHEGVILEFQSHEFALKAFRNAQEPIPEPKEVREYNAYNLTKEDHKAFSISFSPQQYDERAKNVFKEKYDPAFALAKERIDKLETQFEEAILFGDVETVKNVYFGLKKADEFLTSLKNMQLE